MRPGKVLYRAWVKTVETLTSKKFLVFITCTGLLICGHITPELFLPVALAVLGVETALDWRGVPRRTFGDEDAPIPSAPVPPSFEPPVQQP
jgi:hypothetical protein